MLEAEVNNERTILDYLNEDCWRAVLQYVPVQDLIRTERASRRWQGVVLTYLQGVHITLVDKETSDPYTCKLEISEETLQSFESWTKKLGSSIVDAFCNSYESLGIIAKNCPNVEALKFICVDCREHIPYDLSEYFESLQRASFDTCPNTNVCIIQFLTDGAVEELKLYCCYNVTGAFLSSIDLSNLKCLVLDVCRELKPKLYTCYVRDRKLPAVYGFTHAQMIQFKKRFWSESSCQYIITDPCLSQFLAGRALDELKLQSCNRLTGRFFNSVNFSNIKCLVLDSCEELKAIYTLPTIERLGELKKLTMNEIDYETLEEIQHMLDKMPKLEWLEISHEPWMSCHTSEPLSRLTRLKHLRVSWQLGDTDVEAVTRCCQGLHTLEFLDCRAMTQHSIEHLCRHGAQLSVLGLGKYYDAEDDEVVALVRGLPQLTSLTVAGSGALTPALPTLVAAARAAGRRARGQPADPGRRLRLLLSGTNLTDDDYLEEVKGQYEQMKTEYEDLIVVLED